MYLIGCLFTFIIAIAITAYVFLRHVIDAFFGAFGRSARHKTASSREQRQEKRDPHVETQDQRRNPDSRGKIIGDDEGEYVSFEEIR